MTAYFRTLGRARPHCEAAVIGPEPDREALFHLAVIMQREGAHERALALFGMASEAGLAAARTKLGDYHNFGIGPVEEDHARAVALYRAAAEAGDAPAQSTLAIMYRLGRGVPRDPAADGRPARAERRGGLSRLADPAGRDLHGGRRRAPRAGARPRPAGSGQGRRALPRRRRSGQRRGRGGAGGAAGGGAEAFGDPQARIEWLRHAAEQGEARALNTLGFLHERGEGVAYDPRRAAELYVAALETGDLPAADLRGQIDGRWVRWDRETALAFQAILRERGLYRGPLDAQVGRGTMAAARRLAGR